MRRTRFLLVLSTLGCVTPSRGSKPVLEAIPTGASKIADTLHGVEVSDPYRWLEDPTQPPVQEWMKRHDGRARGYIATSVHREALRRRLEALYYVEYLSAPVKRGSRFFYARKPADAEKAIVYVREGEVERILLDPNALSRTRGPVSIGVVEPSPDGRRIAFGLRPNNADEQTLHVMDVQSGAISDVDVIEGAKYAEPSWTPDGAGFYYTWLPTDASIAVADRPGHAEVRFHRIGSAPREDLIIRERLGDPTTFVDATISENGHWLFLSIFRGWGHNELYIRAMPANGHPANDFDGKRGWYAINSDHEALYRIRDHGDALYLHTNEAAERWRVVLLRPFVAPDGAVLGIARSDWKEIVPEDEQAVLQEVSIVGGHMGLVYMRNAASELRLHRLDGAFVRSIELPTLGSVSSLIGRVEDDEAFFEFSSFAHPPTVFRMAIASGKTEVFFRPNVPLDSAAFEVRQVWYPSKDGTKVSMFIVHKKGLEKTGATPTLLYGYGGFNLSMTPTYREYVVPWLESGYIYAMPNLRGGGEYGEQWHRAGMLTKKQNVFDDFIAAGEYLVSAGYTRSDRLAIYGRSNGGLLVGAAMTQRPDLFRSVVCGVPLLDMVRYHRFGSGKTWISEYGSADDASQFPAIVAYSPYHRIAPGTRYPALLMLSTDNDDRVDPMHARKFVAAIQDATASTHPVLLRIEMNAGHGGADQRKASVDTFSDALSFLVDQIAAD